DVVDIDLAAGAHGGKSLSHRRRIGECSYDSRLVHGIVRAECLQVCLTLSNTLADVLPVGIAVLRVTALEDDVAQCLLIAGTDFDEARGDCRIVGKSFKRSIEYIEAALYRVGSRALLSGVVASAAALSTITTTLSALSRCWLWLRSHWPSHLLLGEETEQNIG